MIGRVVMEWNFLGTIAAVFYVISAFGSVLYLMCVRSDVDKSEQIMKKTTALGMIIKILSLSFLLVVLFGGVERILLVVLASSGIGESFGITVFRYCVASLTSVIVVMSAVKCYAESILFYRVRFTSHVTFDIKKIATIEGLNNKLALIKKNHPGLQSGRAGYVPFSKLETYYIIQQELQLRYSRTFSNRKDREFDKGF